MQEPWESEEPPWKPLLCFPSLYIRLFFSHFEATDNIYLLLICVAVPMDESNYAEMAVSEDDFDKDDEDFDPHPARKIGSSKLKRSLDSKKDSTMSNNNSKRRVYARTSNMMEEKRRRNRVWSESDELILLNGFREYKSLYRNKEISFCNYIKHRLSFDSSVNQLSDKLKRLKKKYKEVNSDKNFNDSHQQRLFEASVKIWGGNNNSIKSATVAGEGEHFYSSLLNNYMADKGLDSASLDDATLENFVEEWKQVMLAETYLGVLKAEFERKVCGCKRHVYKAYFKISATPGRF